MIVRVLADNQYRIDDTDRAEMVAFTHLDDEMDAAVEANQEVRFHEALTKLIAYVHQVGRIVPREEVIPSDLIVPAEDTTLAEARSIMSPISLA